MERDREIESGKRKSAERCQLRACEQKFRQAPGMWQKREKEKDVRFLQHRLQFCQTKPHPREEAVFFKLQIGPADKKKCVGAESKKRLPKRVGNFWAASCLILSAMPLEIPIFNMGFSSVMRTKSGKCRVLHPGPTRNNKSFMTENSGKFR
jgi:hypothetical protein